MKITRHEERGWRKQIKQRLLSEDTGEVFASFSEYLQREAGFRITQSQFEQFIGGVSLIEMERAGHLSTLINCPACRREVSSQAGSCPQCGQPINLKNNAAHHIKDMRMRMIGISVAVVCFFLAAMVKGCDN